MLNAASAPSAPAVDHDNPWPGLASFTEDARSFFFGREKETEELVRLIRRNTLTILFGQSGLGKSSLLQAGAFPLLRDGDFLPLYLRLDHTAVIGDHQPEIGNALADQVKAALVDAFKSVDADAPPPRTDETLWEYFHRKDVDIWSAKNRLLTPVLAFDQFEEIFTLGRASDAQRERGRAFLTELADLVENRAPAALREKFDAGELDIRRYNFDKPSCQVVLSLREDFLPDLEGLKHEMRSILHSRMRVKRLDGSQALEIVKRPAPHLIADGAGERIVEFVAGARGGSTERLAELEVEPALLSVICRELNERRRVLGQTQITADLVSGNRREILTDFYERSVADLPAEMRAFVEDHLLTKSGYRDNLALETALEFPGVTRPLIDTLVSRRLLRVEDRLGVQRVELTHDVLAEVIRASRDTRQQRLATEQLRQRERITRRRMWLARTIAAGLLVGLTAVSWVAWRAIRAERAQARLRAEADTARANADGARQRETALRAEADAQKLTALRKAYASDMNALQRALDMDNLGRARELLNRQRPSPGQIDLRGWEWRYLWQFCQSDAQSVLHEPDDIPIHSVATSADGRWAATGAAYGGRIAVYDLKTAEVSFLPAENARARVAFSPREPVLAVAFREFSGTTNTAFRLVLWDVTARQEVRSWDLPASCSGLSFTDDGQHLIIGTGSSRGGGVSIWRVSDGTRQTGWQGGQHASNTGSAWFAATRDGSAAAIVSDNNKLSVLDLKTGETRWTAVATEDQVKTLAFSPDGRLLASCAGFVDSVIRIWDAASGRELGRLEGHRGWVSGLVFLSDGRRLVSSSADQTLRLWNLDTFKPVRAFRGHKTEVSALTVLPDQRTVISGCKDGSVFLWDLERETGMHSSGTVTAAPGAWTFAPDGNSIVTVEYDGHVTRRHGSAFKEETALVEVGRLSPRIPTVLATNQPLLATVGETNKLQVWDWERRKLLQEWEPPTGTTLHLPFKFSADGLRLIVHVTGQKSFAHHEWEIATGRDVRTVPFEISPMDVQGIAYSDDHSRAVLVSHRPNQTVQVDLTSGRSVPFASNTSSPGRGHAFSPDGRYLVLTSQTGYARIFDPTRYQEVATLRGFMFGVHSAGFSPDGQRLAIGSTGTEAATVWDVHTFERLLTLPARAGVLERITFSPDGNVLAGQRAVGARSGTVHIWRAPTWADIEKAEAASGADRTQ